ncbi:MAG: DUF6268 family outer membrane beta-barrel protein [Crocinitomicaceae bacterium]
MKVTLNCLLIFCIGTASAQNWVDLGNIYWRTSPHNSIEGSTDKRNFNMFAADVKLPVVLNDQSVLIFGLGYQHNQFTAVDEASTLTQLDFSSAELQIGMEHKWNDRFKTLFMMIPRMNTDYTQVDIHHFQLAGAVLNTYKRNDQFEWKYGLYYSPEFFAPMFVPLFGFDWKINEKWQFKMMIPVNFELAYRPKDWMRCGLRFDGVNASYRYQLIPSQDNTQTYIDKADNNGWVFTEFNLGKNIWFQLKGGYSVLRKYRFYDPDDRMNLKLGPVNIGDNRTSATPLFKNGWSFETRFIYRLPI